MSCFSELRIVRRLAPLLFALPACAPLRPPALDPGRPHDSEAPSPTAVASSLPKFVSDTNAQPPAPPVVPRTPEPVADCPIRWQPKPLRASVIVIPEAYASRFMTPLFDAVCACSRPGDHLLVAARMHTGEGSVAALTGPREDEGIQANPSVDACLAEVLRGRPFEPFDVPSDSLCEPPPTGSQTPTKGNEADSAPAERPSSFRPPRRVGCSNQGSATIVYPVLVDRRNEVAPSPEANETPKPGPKDRP